MTDGPDQVWELTVAGRHHREETTGSVRRRLVWLVDGEPVAERRRSDDKVQLTADGRPGLGAAEVRRRRRQDALRDRLRRDGPEKGEQ